MAQILAKTPKDLFTKIDAQEFAWHPETAKHRANMRNVPVGSLGRMTEKPTWNNETQQFEGGKIEGGTVQLPDQWKYDPNQNSKYQIKKFFNQPETKAFIREIYGDDIYFQMYPDELKDILK